MSLNIIAYGTYVTTLIPIIVWVGHNCHQNGKPFIMHFADDRNELGKSISTILLIGYYLINIGFAVFIISKWNQLQTKQQLIESLCTNGATILLVLALLHYLNIMGITLFLKR